jgi:RHS repeat-associated protein
MTITDYYVATDTMGSVTAILDDEGNVLERRSYDAFGEMTCMTPDGTPVAESPTEVDVGFQGQIRDEFTGLYQMGFRWYDPQLGRWLSRDIISLAGGVNIDAFVNNNPINVSDLNGLLGCKEGEVRGWKVIDVYDCFNGQTEAELVAELVNTTTALASLLLANEKISLLIRTPVASTQAIKEATIDVSEEITKHYLTRKMPDIADTVNNFLIYAAHKVRERRILVLLGTDICVKAEWEKCEENCIWISRWVKKSQVISFKEKNNQPTSTEEGRAEAAEHAKTALFK